MKLSKKSSLSALFSVALLASFAQIASAQSFGSGGGSIQMGGNGPMGTFGSTRINQNGVSGTFNGGGLSGTYNVGNNGINANTNAGSFGFSMPGEDGAIPTSNRGFDFRGSGSDMGPQGQLTGGYTTGIGSFGSAYSSQGATGDFSHTTGKTNTNNGLGGTGKTKKNNNTIYETTRNNILSTFSTDPSPVPSGSFDYGFKSGGSAVGTGVSLFTRGWYLPPTSTGSVDLNIVSP